MLKFVAPLAAALVLAAPAQAQDAAAGKRAFLKCVACHSIAKGAPNKIGPNLFGVVGRKAGTAPGFRYSAVIPGTSMARRPAAERQFTLAGPGGRKIRVSGWKPRGKAKALVLFSHGAASSPRFYEAIFAPWIAAGHSYGGLVALTMGGAAAVPPEGWSGPMRDPNARAVVAYSPPAPIPVLCTAEGYGKIAVPAVVQTGTKDIVPGITSTDGDGWRGHLVPYEAAAIGGNRYGLVLEGVDHYFGGAICRYDLPGPKQLDRLADAARISALFVDAYGRGEKAAAKRLDAMLTDRLPVMLLRK